MAKSSLDVHAYSDYKKLLNDVLDERCAANARLSKRYFVKKCKLTNPNFFQLVISGRRRLTVSAANKICIGLGFNRYETQHLLLLVELEAASPRRQEELRRSLAALRRRAKRALVHDEAIYRNWMIPIVREVLLIEPTISEARLSRLLGSIADTRMISDAFVYFLRSGWLTRDAEGRLQLADHELITTNDQGREGLRLSHELHLQLAASALQKSSEEREFQGLTIAVPVAKMQHIKKALRGFVQMLNDELSNAEGAEQVVRIQLCAFPIVRLAR